MSLELFYTHCQWNDEDYCENNMKLFSEDTWVYHKGHSCTYSYRKNEQTFGPLPSLRLLGITGSLTYVSIGNPFLEREE